MKLPGITTLLSEPTRPTIHISYFPYEMVKNAPDQEWTRDYGHTQTLNEAHLRNRPFAQQSHARTFTYTTSPRRTRNASSKLLKDTLVGHLYTLFTAPVQ